MVKQYRKQPVVINTIQWTGKNLEELRNVSDGTDRGRINRQPM
jgi:hypothetical protein